jgi:hypothetical protein
MRILFFIPVLLITIFTFSGCEKDDSLDPRPVIVDGQYMRLDIKQDRMDANDIANAYFGGILTNPSRTVVKYELFVRVTRGSNLLSEYIPLYVDPITTFPIDLRITPSDVQQAYERANIDVGAIVNGDKMRFIGYSYDANGRKVGYGDLSRTVQSVAGYKQAYRFNTLLTTNLTSPLSNYEP